MAGMERFTQRARRVLSLAHQEAERARQNNIGTEHLLLGLMDEEGGVAGRVLRDLGMTPERVREVVQRVSGSATNFDPNRAISLLPLGLMLWMPAVVFKSTGGR